MFVCKCELPAVPYDTPLGPRYKCPVGYCKFFGASPMSVDGHYPRVRLRTGEQDHTVYLEACLIPVVPKQPQTSAVVEAAGDSTTTNSSTSLSPSCNAQTHELGFYAKTASARASVLEVLMHAELQGVKVDLHAGAAAASPNAATVSATTRPSTTGPQLSGHPRRGLAAAAASVGVPPACYQYPWSSRIPLLRLLSAAGIAVSPIPTFSLKAYDEMERRYESSRIDSLRLLGDAASDAVVQALLPYQRRGVEFLVEHGGRGLLGDEMGLGKTVQALATAHVYRNEWPFLVLCPPSLVENWTREIIQWLGIPRSRIVSFHGYEKSIPPADELDTMAVAMVSYSVVHKVFTQVPRLREIRVAILDECHWLKNDSARRTEETEKFVHGGWGGGAPRRLILLSGTPTQSRPAELYTLLRMLHADLVPSKSCFHARYCNAHFRDIRTTPRPMLDASGHSHLGELHALLRHFTIRRRKKDVLSELPEKRRHMVYLSLRDSEKKPLQDGVKKLTSVAQRAANADAALSSVSSAPNAFELMQRTAVAKLRAVCEYLDDLLRMTLVDGEKVLVFAHHLCLLEGIHTHLTGKSESMDCILITGSTPQDHRQPFIDHFTNDPACRVAVLSMQTCGTGINFTCASVVIFAELTWVPSTLLQCEDRVHRIGQTSSCTIRYLLADDTVDAIVWPLLLKKMEVSSRLLDNAPQHESSGALERDAVTENIPLRAAPPTPAAAGSGGGGGGGNSQQQSLPRRGTLDAFFTILPQQPRPAVAAVVATDCPGEEIPPNASHSTPVASPQLSLTSSSLSVSSPPVGSVRCSAASVSSPPSRQSAMAGTPAAAAVPLGSQSGLNQVMRASAAPHQLSSTSSSSSTKKTLFTLARPPNPLPLTPSSNMHGIPCVAGLPPPAPPSATHSGEGTARKRPRSQQQDNESGNERQRSVVVVVDDD